LWFRLMVAFEDVHPLEGGAFRRKARRDRRFGLPVEGRTRFYGRYLAENLAKLRRYWSLYRRWSRIHKDVLAAPDRLAYTDIAIAPQVDELETLDLYHATSGGEAALARKRRDDALRARQTAGAPLPAQTAAE
jgi:hypothetical protein